MRASLGDRLAFWLERRAWGRRLVLREDWRSAEFVEPNSGVMRIRCTNWINGHVVLIERTYQQGYAGGEIVS